MWQIGCTFFLLSVLPFNSPFSPPPCLPSLSLSPSLLPPSSLPPSLLPLSSSSLPPLSLPSGGHLDVVRLLVDHGSDLDSQDNRKVSCLMAAFRKVQCKYRHRWHHYVMVVCTHTCTCAAGSFQGGEVPGGSCEPVSI